MTRLTPPPAETPEPVQHAPRLKPRRPWRDKFRDAFRGLKLGVRGHSSFSVHFFFAALVVAAAIALRCALLEWCVLVGCIGLVLTAELVNSAIETLFHGLDERTKTQTSAALDIAAGAVLVASMAAALIGGLVFFHCLGCSYFPNLFGAMGLDLPSLPFPNTLISSAWAAPLVATSCQPVVTEDRYQENSSCSRLPSGWRRNTRA